MMRDPTAFVFCAAALALEICAVSALEKPEEFDGVYGHGDHAFTVATGSPGELGLLEALAREFSTTHDTTVRWKNAGSGQALTWLREKKADVVLVHAPVPEELAVHEGWAADRTLVGANEFLIVGPAQDPAQIRQASSVVEAYRRLAAAKAKFLSRGDNSGTHQREMAIWKQAALSPDGDWYVVTNDFMLATLKRANVEGAYFMTDSSSWIAAKVDVPRLVVVFRGDPELVNVYHALCQPQGATPGQLYASQFVAFLRSDAGQAIIRDHGRKQFGEALYRDASSVKPVAE